MSFIAPRPATIGSSWKPKRPLSQYPHMLVAPSRTCGLGMHTEKPFKKGRVVLKIADDAYTSTALPYKTLINQGLTDAQLFQVDLDSFIPPYGGLDDFTNHSCQPNCGLQVHRTGFQMIALRDIAAYEELTYDYSTHMENPHEAMVCHCGSPSCRGVVRSFSTLDPDLQRHYLYLGIVADFVVKALQTSQT